MGGEEEVMKKSDIRGKEMGRVHVVSWPPGRKGGPG